MMDLENKLQTLVGDAFTIAPSGGENGDYGCAVFAEAKKRGVNPADLAKELAKEWGGFAVGPYVNFTVSEEEWKQVAEELLKGREKQSGRGKIVVDYGGENVAKPQSVGHLRSNIIGQAFCNLAREVGYEVVGDNHIGDWGTQFGKLGVAIAKWGSWEELCKMEDPIEELLALYQKFHVEAEMEKSLEEEARKYFAELAAGDVDKLKQWEQICEWTKKNLSKSYARMGVKFDVILGESFYRGERMEKVIMECERAGLTTRNEDGSLAIIPPEETSLPSFLIQKSDGATLYHTSDLATIEYRLQEFKPQRIVYFVAEQQSLHFKQLFWLAEKLGLTEAKLEHASFGLVRLPEGTMSTRKGNIVRLMALLDEAHERALAVIKEKQPDVPESEWEELAEMIGVGAIIYADLGKDRTKSVVFDWKTALSFEGQSGPYLQYAYARACAILRKAEGDKIAIGKITEKEEKDLLKTLLGYEKVLEKAVEEAKPSYMAQWLFDLATVFNKFYVTQPVLKAEGETRETRLALTKIFAENLKKGLEILGMRAPERM